MKNESVASIVHSPRNPKACDFAANCKENDVTWCYKNEQHSQCKLCQNPATFSFDYLRSAIKSWLTL